jgi:hypothetical protein
MKPNYRKVDRTRDRKCHHTSKRHATSHTTPPIPLRDFPSKRFHYTKQLGYQAGTGRTQ